MPTVPTMPTPPTRLRSASALSVGSITTGALAYVFFALTTRALGATEAAPVSVLWTWWGLTAAALTFPVQHWVARSVAAHGGEGPVRAALPRVGALGGGAAAVAAGAAWLLREPLFDGHGAVFPLLTAGVALAATWTGVVRGVLSARGRFPAVAALLVAENAARCVLAVGLSLAGVGSPAAYGLALLLGYAVLLLWPSALRPTGQEQDLRSTRSPMGLLGATAGGQLLAQVVLTGSPLVLALGGAPARDVTVLFAGLALFRAPYLVAVGQVTQLTGMLTRLVVDGRTRRLARIRRGLVLLTAAAALAATGAGALLGPWLLPVVFGGEVRLGVVPSALVAAGSTVALGTLVATVLVIATGRTWVLPGGWAVALLPGTAWIALAPGDLLLRTCGAFVLVEVAAFAWFVVASAGTGRSGSARGEEDRGAEG